MTAETTKSVLPWPVMTLWQQIDGDVLFTHEPTVLRSEEMRQPTPEHGSGSSSSAGIGIKALDLRYYSEAQRPLLIQFAACPRKFASTCTSPGLKSISKPIPSSAACCPNRLTV